MGGTREQKRTVQRFASEWIRGGLEKHIRFVFDTPLERSHIRVSFKKNGGNVSEVGVSSAPTAPEPRLRGELQGNGLRLLHLQRIEDCSVGAIEPKRSTFAWD